MLTFIKIFNCGYCHRRGNVIDFLVTKLEDIEAKIIPFFNKYNIRGVKSEDYSDWCIVAHMILEKMHFTKEDLDQIRRIKAGVNRGRKLN